MIRVQDILTEKAFLVSFLKVNKLFVFEHLSVILLSGTVKCACSALEGLVS